MKRFPKLVNFSISLLIRILLISLRCLYTIHKIGSFRSRTMCYYILWGRISSLWEWWSTGTGCPGRLWSLLLWRYSRPAWTRSSTAYCRWPCFGRGVGLDDPQRSLPTPIILWFCDSICYKFKLCVFFMLNYKYNI